MLDEKTLKQFERWGKQAPEHIPHLTEEEIRSNLQRAKTHSWKLEGNKLTAETDLGPLVQFIPTDYVCHGTDEKGLPILKKITL